MKQYTLTIKIADMGTPIKDHKGNLSTSKAGHMWYSVSNGVDSRSFGYGRGSDSKIFKDGKVTEEDDASYLKTFYTATIPITPWQYQTLLDYGKNSRNYGFNSEDYYLITNSCIDFTWKELEAVGINKAGYEGELVPSHNAESVSKLFYNYTHPNAPTAEAKRFLDYKNQVFGSSGDDVLDLSKPNNDGKIIVFGGDDSIYGYCAKSSHNSVAKTAA